MKKIYITLLFLFPVLNLLAQQDPQFNLYQFNQMIINPAYAGARDNLAVVALRRQQWVGIGGAPVTNCLSMHGPILNKNLGLGLTVQNDQMGPRNVIGIYGNVAYILKINSRIKLSFGMNGGYNRYQFQFNEIEFKNAEVPPELSRQQNQSTFDINSGLFLRCQTFFMGVSATHLNSPTAYSYQSTAGQNKFTYQLKSHLFLTVGKSFTMNENLVFAPTTLIKFVDGRTGIDLNLNFFLYSRLWLGAFYRNGYGPGALMQFYFNRKFRAGISYDTGIMDQRRLGPSFEAMIGFDFGTGGASRLLNPRFL